MPFEKVKPEKPVSELTPLDVKCTSTRCNDNLHCFKLNQKLQKKYGKKGVCRNCGADLVDWDRVRMNNLKDADYTFQMLQQELIRHVFWHTEIKPEAIKLAHKRGLNALKQKAKEELRKKVGSEKNFREGYQTPKGGNEIINYAQHATATCCRKCIEYWYDIPLGVKLTDQQIDFFAELILKYINARVKDLTAAGKEEKNKQ